MIWRYVSDTTPVWPAVHRRTQFSRDRDRYCVVRSDRERHGAIGSSLFFIAQILRVLLADCTT
eukprot:UN00402